MDGKPSVRVDVDTICIDPGETLTVWLRKYNTQAELRVKPDGTMEVFVPTHVAVRTFEHWYEIHRKTPNTAVDMRDPQTPKETDKLVGGE